MCKKRFHLTISVLILLLSVLQAAENSELEPKLERLGKAVSSAYIHAYGKCMEQAQESCQRKLDQNIETLKAK